MRIYKIFSGWTNSKNCLYVTLVLKLGQTLWSGYPMFIEDVYLPEKSVISNVLWALSIEHQERLIWATLLTMNFHNYIVGWWARYSISYLQSASLSGSKQGFVTYNCKKLCIDKMEMSLHSCKNTWVWLLFFIKFVACIFFSKFVSL